MRQEQQLDLDYFWQQIEPAGLDLLACVPAEIISRIDYSPKAPDGCEYLLLVGGSGRKVWEGLRQSHGPVESNEHTNPLDDYTTASLCAALRRQLSDRDWEILYPDNSNSGGHWPLQEIGRHCGWHFESPLGIGVNSVCGLWFAYRSLIALKVGASGLQAEVGRLQVESGRLQLEANVRTTLKTSDTESPCLSCVNTPCVQTCPADALTLGAAPNLDACVSHRTKDGSSCAQTCLARIACPLAAGLQYSEDQLAYFYGRSLASAKRWTERP